MLEHLRVKAEATRRVANQSPTNFRLNIDGKQTLPDGATITLLRERFLGNAEALLELPRLVEDRKVQLTEQIKQLEQEQLDAREAKQGKS